MSAYALNRWVFSPQVLRGWFSDVLLIPVGLPVFLLLERHCGLRRHDAPPTAREVVFLFVVWSFAAEVVAPWLSPNSTADVWDVVAYSAGALVAWFFWSRKAR